MRACKMERFHELKMELELWNAIAEMTWALHIRNEICKIPEN